MNFITIFDPHSQTSQGIEGFGIFTTQPTKTALVEIQLHV